MTRVSLGVSESKHRYKLIYWFYKLEQLLTRYH